MVNVHIIDDILYNILARLPGKTLLRLRCVSPHWNRVISNPGFMKSRSRRMIMSPYPEPLVVIDDNVPVEDKANSVVRIRSPVEYYQDFSILGTFNGIVVLVLNDMFLSCELILYNPLTRASKKLLLDSPSPTYQHPIALGFGYGTITSDLKIVRFTEFGSYYKCDVFNLKTSSWSRPSQYIKQAFSFWGKHVGVFVNGFLYWQMANFKILALNVEDMVFSKIKLPHGLKGMGLLLGSQNGRLCMINKDDTNRFDIWLMNNEHGVENSWLKTRSFTLGPKVECDNMFCPSCILGNGKIVFINSEAELVIYDTSKDSYKTFNRFTPHETPYRCIYLDSRAIRSIEYVESLVQPSNICLT